MSLSSYVPLETEDDSRSNSNSSVSDDYEEIVDFGSVLGGVGKAQSEDQLVDSYQQLQERLSGVPPTRPAKTQSQQHVVPNWSRPVQQSTSTTNRRMFSNATPSATDLFGSRSQLKATESSSSLVKKILCARDFEIVMDDEQLAEFRRLMIDAFERKRKVTIQIV